jgi:hypothetical protein
MRFAHVGHPASPSAGRASRAPIGGKGSLIQHAAAFHETFAQIISNSARLHIVASGFVPRCNEGGRERALPASVNRSNLAPDGSLEPRIRYGRRRASGDAWRKARMPRETVGRKNEGGNHE